MAASHSDETNPSSREDWQRENLLHAVDPRSGSVVDRRSGLDRRRGEVADPTNLERRRGPGRRLSDFVRDAEEGEMNKEQFMFLMAIDAFKREYMINEAMELLRNSAPDDYELLHGALSGGSPASVAGTRSTSVPKL